MLFLMDQNVFRKGAFEVLQKLIFCVQKNRFLKALNLDMWSFKLQLLFCVFFPLVNKDFPLILQEMDKEPEQMCTKGSIVL